MITYKSKRHPNLFVTSDGIIDPKFKTVLITLPNGKVQSISSSTLANQYEIVEVETTSEVPEKSEVVDSIPSIQDIVDRIAITMGGAVKTWDSKPNIIAVTYNKKSVMEICTSRKSFKVRVKPEILRSDEEYVAHSYNFGATITLDYNEIGYSALESLITRSIVYSSNKPRKTRKTTKEEK